MAKKKLQLGSGGGLLNSAMKDAVKKFGDENVYVAAEHAKHSWGLPIDNIPFEWLVGGTNIVPMQRIMGVCGPQRAGKSVLMMELGRWFTLSGGLAILCETEQKSSNTLIESLFFREPNLLEENFIYNQALNIETWQEQLIFWTSKIKDKLDKEDTVVPAMIWIDSLMGRDVVNEQNNLQKEGHADARGYSEAALSLSKFFRRYDVTGYPITFGFVNHLKSGIDGADVRPGGVHQDYAASLLFKVSCKNQSEDVKSVDYFNDDMPGYVVKRMFVSCIKSSLGDDNRKIELPLKWRHVPGAVRRYVDGEEVMEDGSVQQTWFDWDEALASLILDRTTNGTTTVRDALKDLISITKQSNLKWSASKLGIQTEPPWIIGKAINSDPDLKAKVRSMLSINSARSFEDRFING